MRKATAFCLVLLVIVLTVVLFVETDQLTSGAAMIGMGTQAKSSMALNVSESVSQAKASMALNVSEIVAQASMSPNTSEIVAQARHSSPLISAVIVENRCHESLLATLEILLRQMKGVGPVILWHASSNGAFVSAFRSVSPLIDQSLQTKALVFHLFNPASFGVLTGSHYNPLHWYNRLMTSPRFWKSFTTPMVLTTQVDAIVCRPVQELVDNYGNVSYIGGVSGVIQTFQRNTKKVKRVIKFPPHSPGNDSIATPQHLNGGLSLRNVRWQLDCIAAVGKVVPWIEDDLTAHCSQDELKRQTHVTTALMAYRFSSNHGITMCFETHGSRVCPFGVHKPWDYATVLSGLRKQERGANKATTPQEALKDREMFAELQTSCPDISLISRKQNIQLGMSKCKAVDSKGAEFANLPCSARG
jgi:hypothetical protein